MEKISSQKVASVLSTVPGMLRTLASERDELLEKNAQLDRQVQEYRRRDRVNQVAKTAEAKGIDSLGESYEEKVASIEAAMSKGKSLDVMEEAIKMSSPRGDLAGLSGDELEGGSGGTQLEAYLLGELHR
jgi:hypothetical protein